MQATKTQKLRYCPVLDLPPLSQDELEGLKNSIAVEGVLVPILTVEEATTRWIIDGVHRKMIADEFGYECPEEVIQADEEEQRSLRRCLNLARRQLGHHEKRRIIADQLEETPEKSNRSIAKMLGVDDKTVGSVRRAGAEFPHLDFRQGADGKWYPAEILHAATEIRKQQNQERIERQVREEKKAKRNGRKSWKITAEQKVIQADLLISDPPMGVTKESWDQIDDLEGYTKDWCYRWSKCDADFIAIFWSTTFLFEGRQWFDDSLEGYKFQQLLVWHTSNNGAARSSKLLKPSWFPIFLYRRAESKRQIIIKGKEWTGELHNMDCHIAAVPQTVYNGTELKVHPAQKPVSVYSWLIHALSNRGELVVDNYCGSSSSGIAAAQLGRRYHGIESSAKYRKLAERRIAKYGIQD